MQDAPVPPNPKELGWVQWGRDYEAAEERARTSGKPIFLLFQEVPGCSTCVGFGESVLSHPLLVEAIESEFVPLAIHNNKSGADSEVLARFSEPEWNNPVVRLVDEAGADLLPRVDGVWSTHEIATRMVDALTAHGRDVPDYLRWVVTETAPAKRATFAMGCYWRGEACLGDLPGVVATTAGSLGGREVVEVSFDRDVTDEATLRHAAESRECGDFVARARPAREASDADRKYYLSKTAWRHMPLTPMQASRVNAALGRGEDPLAWVSPQQRALFKRVAEAPPQQLVGLAPPESAQKLASYQQALVSHLSQRPR